MNKPDKFKKLTKKDLLERLSIGKETLRTWENRFDVFFELDEEGRKTYPPDSVRFLEQVKQLREEEKSFEEIEKVLERRVPEGVLAGVPGTPKVDGGGGRLKPALDKDRVGYQVGVPDAPKNRVDLDNPNLTVEGGKIGVEFQEEMRQICLAVEELRVTNRMLRVQLEEKKSLDKLEQEVKKTALKLRVFSVVLIVVGVLGLGYELAEIGYIGQDTLFWGCGSVALGLLVRFS
jgi:DNA-binding transcriptional MerR regulator